MNELNNNQENLNTNETIQGGWVCDCGEFVADSFCTYCGSWKCACGALAKGKFCTRCGSSATNSAPTQGVACANQPVATAKVNSYSDPNGCEVIDLSPYPVGIQNVEFDPSKDYTGFHRATGLVGAIPQKFIDVNMLKCPLCCGTAPNWSISQKNLKTWRGNLALFKCEQCDGVISISIPDIMTATNQFSPGAANVTLTNMAIKKKNGKEAKTAYATIEFVARSGVSPEMQGKELRLPDMQAISNRR
jgi:hypothetical protein